MRKNLPVVLLFLSLFSSAKLFAQFKINEGFEGTFLPTGWTSYSALGANVWEADNTQSHAGTFSAFNDYESTGGEDWLVTPKITGITAGDNLTFWVRRQFNSSYPPDDLDVRVSTNATLATPYTNAKFATSLQVINIANLANATWVQYSFPLASFAGQDIFIAFKHTNTDGNGMYLDDVAVSSPVAIDAGLTDHNIFPAGIVAVGTSLTITDTVKNFGTSPLAAGVPVKYSVDGGPVLATKLTTTIIPPGGFEEVIFSGATAFTPAAPGIYVVTAYSDQAGDGNHANDTLRAAVIVQAPKNISAGAYFENFTDPIGWTLDGDAGVWYLINEGSFTNPVTLAGPNGVTGDTALLADFYNIAPGTTGYIRSPLLNLTGVAKPILNFYVSYGSFPDGPVPDDALEVVVSTDGGLTYQPAPLYSKSYASTPTLATDTVSENAHIPGVAKSWRHESVDLTAYANQPKVIVAFRAISAFGNWLFLDNVNIVSQNPLYYYTSPVTTAGQTIGPINNKVTFTTLGNTAGGSIVFEGNVGNMPLNNRFATNTTATAPDGTIFTPDITYPLWTTITYTGNDSARAVYSISIDVSTLPLANPNKIYFIKRCDESGDWVALTTTKVGSIITAAGLTNFSEFAIGSLVSVNPPTPVTLISFNGSLVRNQVNLKWATAYELNNKGFEIEKRTGGTWDKIGFVQSKGNSSNNTDYGFLDKTPAIGYNYYRLKQIDADGRPTYSNTVKIELKTDKNITVFQNTPNPFVSTTSIRYTLAQNGAVKINVFSPDGKLLATLVNENKAAGTYEATWDAKGVAAGTYYYKVIAGGEVTTYKMMKVK